MNSLNTSTAFMSELGRVILRKPKPPVGRHLAPKKSATPLTEIAQVVVSGELQKRAAVVAAAGGLFISSFGAANLDFSGADDAVEAYQEAELAPGADEHDGADSIGSATENDADEVLSVDDAVNADDASEPDESGESTGSSEPTDAIEEDLFEALPGWEVVGVAYEAPEAVTEEGLAVVSVTPAPPPRPVARATRAAATNPPPASVAGNAVLEIAARYVGTPYAWGGNTPAGFDCSGFTSYVFAQLGISLPRTSSGQRNVGTVVSRADAQAGDLVWWRGHVGIFVEGNTFIDAAGPGRTVQFREMWNSNPTFIRL